VTRTNAFPTTTSSLAVCAIALLVASCGDRTAPPSGAAQESTSPEPTPANPVSVGAASMPSAQYKLLGNESAPVRIVEFTDLQCAYCARFARETFPLLRERYIDTGKVRFESVDLPLPMHEFANTAAIAARCAGEQGHYWDYREKLFDEQNLLGQKPFTRFAGALGLDIARFEYCRLQDSQLKDLDTDRKRASVLDIHSTPTFLIGRMVDGRFESETVQGAQPSEVFAARIEKLLASEHL
jgi:protein-disulfide isomerase